MFTSIESDTSAIIKVVGIGGAGSNALNHIIHNNFEGIEFIAANTDFQALEVSKAPVKIKMGEKSTFGLGAGANPTIGRDAAIESEHLLKTTLTDSDMVILVAGLGGGTGTGAVPIIAEFCKELGVLTVAVVTLPFSFEGKKRMRQANEAVYKIEQVADTVITIANDRLRSMAGKKAKMVDMFKKADDILLYSVRGVTDLIRRPGLVNLDFADVKSILSESGIATIGIGAASGKHRAIEAAEKSISEPLLDGINISDAKGILMNITSSDDITHQEMTEAADTIYYTLNDTADTDILWGAVIDNDMGDEMRVTVIITGIFNRVDNKDSNKDAVFSCDGKVRDIAPKDLIVRNKMDESAAEQPERQNVTKEPLTIFVKNYKRSGIDSEYLDVPNFIRRRPDQPEDKNIFLHPPSLNRKTTPSSFPFIEIEKNEIWIKSYNIFNKSSCINDRTLNLKKFRDLIIKEGGGYEINQKDLEKAIALLNTLWSLSKNNRNAPAFIEIMTKLLHTVKESNLSKALSSYYNFLNSCINVQSAPQITKIKALTKDSYFIIESSNAFIRLPKEFLSFNECIKNISIESKDLHNRQKYKILHSKLQSIVESLQKCSETPESICLLFITNSFRKIVKTALITALDAIKCDLIQEDTIFFNYRNKLKIDIVGGHKGETFDIVFPPINDYEVNHEKISVVFKEEKQSVSFELIVTPLKTGDLRLVLTLDEKAFTFPLYVIPMNPFIVGRPVKNDEMFFGRKALLDEIKRGLLAPNSINYILTGRRRIGKTSFLYALKRSLPKYVLPVIISMEVSDKSLTNIFQLFVSEISHSALERNLKLSKNLVETKIDGTDPRGSFLSWLRMLMPALQSNSISRVFLLIDEALKITELNQHAQSLFRFVFSNFEGINGILASPPDIISRLNYDVSSPWYNIFTTIKIGPFDRQETISLIEDSFRSYNIKNINDIAEKTFHYSGGIPFYIQAIGYEILEAYFKCDKQKEANNLNLRILLEKLSTSYPIVLENLTPTEKITIVSIANDIAPPDACTHILAENDLIKFSNGKWIMPARIEKEWVVKLSDRLLNSAGQALWDKYGSQIKLPRLMNEIDLINNELIENGNKFEFIKTAADAAKSNEGAKALAYLASTGKWALDAATKIGTAVASDAIKLSLGLK